jgi:prevent-host-death family protein
MTYALPITHVRKHFLKLVDEIDENYTRVDVTKNGRVKVTIVSSDYLDSLEETIFSLENSLQDIRLAEKEVADGKFVTLDEIKKRIF